MSIIDPLAQVLRFVLPLELPSKVMSNFDIQGEKFWQHRVCIPHQKLQEDVKARVSLY